MASATTSSKGDFLRVEVQLQACSAQGIDGDGVAAHEGSFAPWWKQLSVEVYGARKPAARCDRIGVRSGSDAAAVPTGFDAEHHRITALVPDDGKGLELQLTY